MNNCLKRIFMCSLLALSGCDELSAEPTKPNIIILYVDDLGYGDIGINGATGVRTPNIDQLAAEGLNFTDAHSTAATCTPSRYALLTGEHGFRINSDILEGDAPALIEPGRPTLPRMLNNAGYNTAVIGKWHLGFGNGNIDWNGKVAPGPLELGFDYSFLMPITGDRVPTVFLENYSVVNLNPDDPVAVNYTGKIGERPMGSERPDLVRYAADPQHNETIINGVPRIGSMSGGEAALWVDEDIPEVFTSRALDFIRENQKEPFFLFYSFHDIHVPRLPHPDFEGTTSLGPRGDAIAQVDWVVGTLIAEVKELGLEKDTLILFTSDNGPVLNDGYEDGAVSMLGSHKPAGPYRGGKYSAYEAGTRMPTIVNWPGNVAPGVSNALVSQIDLYASLAKFLGIALEDGEAIDSLDTLAAFLGKSQDARDYIIEESVGTLSLRKGSWKYIHPTPEVNMSRAEWVAVDKDIEGGFVQEQQLYNLDTDPGEQTNVALENPDLVEEMRQKLKTLLIKGFRQ